MNSTKTTRFNSFYDFLSKIIYSRNLIIFIGAYGVHIIALERKQIKDSWFVKNDIQNDISNYINFFQKYPDYNVTILIDSADCIIESKPIVVMPNILKSTPIENFIYKEKDKTDIVAYRVHSINKRGGEVWDSSIASAPYVEPLNIIIEYLINHSMLYSGSYFLNLEFEYILRDILKRLGKNQFLSHLQIFICITRASGIRLAVLHHSKLLDHMTIPYPVDKSDEFILGTIEQAINDKLVKFKDYAAKYELEFNITTLCDRALQKLFKTINFADCNVITVTTLDIGLDKKQANDRFIDKSLIQIFNDSKHNIGYNPKLKLISNLNFWHSIIFKPFILLIVGLSLTLIGFNVSSYNIRANTQVLNKQYYELSERYKDIKRHHRNVSNINKLAELFALERIINQETPSPFLYTKQLFYYQNKKIRINDIKWHLSDNNIQLHGKNQNICLHLSVEYRDKISNFQQALSELDEYAKYLQKMHNNFEISLTIDEDRMIFLSEDMILPAYISIVEK